MTQTYIITARSANEKIGNLVAITRPQWTCPTDCPFYHNGCYAENFGARGRPPIFDMIDKALAKADGHMTIDDVINRKWKKIPRGVRVGVAGDFLNMLGLPDMPYIEDTNRLAVAHPWVTWGYTHAWKRLRPAMFKYIVRASTQSREEAEEAIDAGWRAVIVDPGPDDPDTLINTYIRGQKVIQCPQETGQRKSCEECLLCGRDAPSIVAFVVHGAKKKKAAEAVRARRALPVITQEAFA